MFVKVFFKNSYLFLWNFVNLLGQLFPDNNFGNKTRGVLFRAFFKKCGNNLQISKSVNILYPYNIIIGDNVYIGFSSWLNAQGNIVIDDEVMFGPFVSVATGNHTRKNENSLSYRFGEHIKKEVQFKKGCWIAANVTVLPGTVVGKGTILGAGCVANGILDDDSLYVGIPAKKKGI